MIISIDNFVGTPVERGIFPSTAFCYYHRPGCLGDKVGFSISQLNKKNGWFSCDRCYADIDKGYERILSRPQRIHISGGE